MNSRPPAWLPTPNQLLLLRACLWEEPAAFEVWRAWRRAQPDLDRLDAGSTRLLPLLYRNLEPRLKGDDAEPRLRDAYRRSWISNQLGLRVAREAIDTFADAGLEVLALKGAALVGTAYADPGARPMGDVDLAVPADRVGGAVAALAAAGFAPSEPEPERILEVRHSLPFRNAGGFEVDLHRGLLWRAGLDDEFWLGSVEAEVAGRTVRVLEPADQLLHVCAHGAAWNPIPPVRWAADAFKVLQAAGETFNWDRLVAMAERGRLVLPLRDALSCLAADLRAPVPAEAVRALGALSVSNAERRAHEAVAQPPSSRRSTAMLWWFWERHRAQAQLDGRRPTPAGLLRYLQDFWGLERPSRVPGYATRRLLRRR